MRPESRVALGAAAAAAAATFGVVQCAGDGRAFSPDVNLTGAIFGSLVGLLAYRVTKRTRKEPPPRD